MSSLNGLDDDVMPLEERFRKVSKKFRNISTTLLLVISNSSQGVWVPRAQAQVQEDRLQHVSRRPQQLQDEEQGHLLIYKTWRHHEMHDRAPISTPFTQRTTARPKWPFTATELRKVLKGHFL